MRKLPRWIPYVSLLSKFWYFEIVKINVYLVSLDDYKHNYDYFHILGLGSPIWKSGPTTPDVALLNRFSCFISLHPISRLKWGLIWLILARRRADIASFTFWSRGTQIRKLVATIPDKIFGRKQRNPVTFDKKRNVLYPFLLLLSKPHFFKRVWALCFVSSQVWDFSNIS